MPTNEVITDRLHPEQRQAIAAMFMPPKAGVRQSPLVLAAGQGGAGKTWTLIFAHLYWHLFHVHHLGVQPMPPSCLLVENEPLMLQRIVGPALRDWGGYWEFYGAGSREGRCLKFRDPRAGKVILYHASELDQLRGMEFSMIGIEELSTFPQYQSGEFILDLLEYPLRKAAGCFSLPVMGSSNWDGPGQSWMRQAWWPLDAKPDEEGKIFGRDAERFIYVPFTLDAHPDQVYAEEQRRKMSAYTGSMRESRLYGRPGTPTGAAFPMFQRGVQTFRFAEKFPRGVPQHWTRFVGIDWGILDPFAALWFAIDEEGDFWLYRERYAANLGDEEQAWEVVNHTTSDEQIEVVWYDPTMDISYRNRNDLTPGKPVSAAFREILNADKRFGAFLPGDNRSRTNGIRMLGSLLMRLQGKVLPNLHISDDCVNTIREIEGAKWAMVGGVWKDDLDPKVPDHSLTAAMYGLLKMIGRKASADAMSLDDQLALIASDANRDPYPERPKLPEVPTFARRARRPRI